MRRRASRDSRARCRERPLSPAAAPAAAGPFGPPAAQGSPLPPEDATTLARASLVRIQGKIRTALAGKAVTDATTRAYLQETDARVSAALTAQLDRRVE